MHYGFSVSCLRPGWAPPEPDQMGRTCLGSPSLEPRLEIFRRIVRYNPVGYKLFRTQSPVPGGPRQVFASQQAPSNLTRGEANKRRKPFDPRQGLLRSHLRVHQMSLTITGAGGP